MEIRLKPIGTNEYTTRRAIRGCVGWNNIVFRCDDMVINVPNSSVMPIMNAFFMHAFLTTGEVGTADCFNKHYWYRKMHFGHRILFLPFSTHSKAHRVHIRLYDRLEMPQRMIRDMIADLTGMHINIAGIIGSYDDNRYMRVDVEPFIAPLPMPIIRKTHLSTEYFYIKPSIHIQIMTGDFASHWKINPECTITQIAFWIEDETEFDPHKTVIVSSCIDGTENWTSAYDSLVTDKIDKKVAMPSANIHTLTFVNEAVHKKYPTWGDPRPEKDNNNPLRLRFKVSNVDVEKRLIIIATLLHKN